MQIYKWKIKDRHQLAEPFPLRNKSHLLEARTSNKRSSTKLDFHHFHTATNRKARKKATPRFLRVHKTKVCRTICSTCYFINHSARSAVELVDRKNGCRYCSLIITVPFFFGLIRFLSFSIRKIARIANWSNGSIRICDGGKKSRKIVKVRRVVRCGRFPFCSGGFERSLKCIMRKSCIFGPNHAWWFFIEITNFINLIGNEGLVRKKNNARMWFDYVELSYSLNFSYIKFSIYCSRKKLAINHITSRRSDVLFLLQQNRLSFTYQPVIHTCTLRRKKRFYAKICGKFVTRFLLFFKRERVFETFLERRQSDFANSAGTRFEKTFIWIRHRFV